MPVSNYFIKYFLHQVDLLGTYSSDDMDKIKYSLQSIFYECEKILILCIVFALFNQLDYYLITLIVLLSIRLNTGGYHSKSNLGCLLLTFFMFFIAINIFSLVHLSNIIKYMLAFLSLLVILLTAPVLSVQKQKVLTVNITVKKILSFAITTFWFIIFFYKNNTYTVSVLGIIFLQSMQLLFEYMKRGNINEV